ncbi:ThiF family adenylyltransferase [Methylophaga sp.]|uniref:HesA/MoeB/ThiF family protein n=1 Tax=Methylophaga sp. TaxID=2024840 RepID=UPI0025F88723|nr:ThiF family adenylyltransferase [Methylophaga sp.]
MEETASSNSRRFNLHIPELPDGRTIDTAWIDIPSDFAAGGIAKILLPKKYVLKIPHVDEVGYLCIDGDPGPMSGSSPIERVEQLIDQFYSLFLEPWSRGELDSHFTNEAMNYWKIHYSRCLSPNQAVVKIYTTNGESDNPKIYKSTFIESRGIIIAGDASSIQNRYINALSFGSTISSVLITEIPIAYPFIPDNWPKNLNDIQRLITARLEHNEAGKFLKFVGRRNRSIHKVVIFRAPGCAFGYLLPGGPPSKIKKRNSVNSFPNDRLVPILVERLDVGWITGRDQHPEYIDRQLKHVLIIGLGALGSPVAEQLAKSGVGKLTMVDHDKLSSANIGRHTLGVNSIGFCKVDRLAESISLRWASCNALGVSTSIKQWLKTNTLKDVDIIIDLTGEPDVRLLIDHERKKHDVDLLIAWMEPNVASAHACIFPVGYFWVTNNIDRLDSLNAVEWPEEIMVKEPACSSTFQSYTSAAATHAVALTTEAAIDLIDSKIKHPIVRHWIRGQNYLDQCYPGLKLKEWASFAHDYDGIMREFPLD